MPARGHLTRALLVAALLAGVLFHPATARADDIPSYEFATPVLGLSTAPDGSLLVADAGAGVVELRKGQGSLIAQLPAVADIAPIGRGSQENRLKLRVAAEWEPATGVSISWPLSLPKSLVIELAKDVDLYLTVANENAESEAEATLTGWGIDREQLHFLVTDQGLWGYPFSRDWGPSALFDEKGNYTLVDGRYLGYPWTGLESSRDWLRGFQELVPAYKPDDDDPAAVAQALGVPRLELPISMTGGNLEFDGHGTAFATQIMVDENRVLWGVSEGKLRQILREKLGVTQFNVLPNYETGPGIQHVDCLLKLLDPERILVKRVPTDHADYEAIEDAVKVLEGLKNVYGRPYKILRIDTPRYQGQHVANYANALILNRRVYVPLFGIDGDAKALETWRAAMPGYQVLGFQSPGGFDAWTDNNAIHCRTRAIWEGYVSGPPRQDGFRLAVA